MKRCLFISVVLFCTSCNYKFFVNKRQVVNEQKGYLFYFNSEVFFFPYKKSMDSVFLSSNHSDGFKINSRDGMGWLDSLAKNYEVYISKSIPALNQKKDTISLLQVSLRYYLGKEWDGSFEKKNLFYYWNSERRLIKYRIYDFRNILQISLVRKEDIKKI